MNNKIYFDNAATTKMRKEVLEYFFTTCEKYYANPSSVHTLGREARVMLEKARSNIANLLNVKSQDIIFTSGATEANNLALKGIMEKSKKKEIISSYLEHSSVLKVLNQLENEGYIVHLSLIHI